MKPNKELSRSETLASKVLYAAMRALREYNGELPARRVIEEVGKTTTFNDWEKGVHQKTGNVRWKSVLHFYSIDCVKAGFLIKKNGVWYLTPEGESALSKNRQDAFFQTSKAAYKQWKAQQNTSDDKDSDDMESIPPSGAIESSTQSVEAQEEQIEALALEGIRKFLLSKNPYELQDVAAALLRGMGYFTPFVAPRGKDGGVDIIAYRDPLGTVAPRIKVQVKHRQDSTGAPAIRELIGVLKDGDVGICVSTGGFSPDAKTTARAAQVHIELIDVDRLITLWREFYERLSDEDKILLPLRPIHVLALA